MNKYLNCKFCGIELNEENGCVFEGEVILEPGYASCIKCWKGSLTQTSPKQKDQFDAIRKALLDKSN